MCNAINSDHFKHKLIRIEEKTRKRMVRGGSRNEVTGENQAQVNKAIIAKLIFACNLHILK